MSELDKLLHGALVHDGTGAPPRHVDIGISGERIAFMGTGPVSARQRIDLAGLILCPGFIDTHGHSEFTALACPQGSGKLMQGVTTEINGNCGLAAGPLLGTALAQREPDFDEYGIRERWATLGEYLSILGHRGYAMNYATLVGHGNLRASVMGFADRLPTSAEMDGMQQLLVDALRQGALGMSSGLVYPPGVYCQPTELIALCRAGCDAIGQRFIYTTHMRSEGDRLLESIEETLHIGREAHCRVHISHLKTYGRQNWGKLDAALSLIESAQQAGQHVTADRYPYTAASTDLDAVLPAWAYEGGSEAELMRLQDPAQRARLLEAMPSDMEYWQGVLVARVQSERNSWVEGRSIADIAVAMGKPPKEAVLDLLIDERLRVGAIYFAMDEGNLSRILSKDYVMIGTDASARCFEGPTSKGKPHPRGFGSFSRYLSGIPAERLSWAIHKCTGLAANTFGLTGRGRIEVDYSADLVAFDHGALRDNASYAEPFSPPSGIVHVFVNGQAAVVDGLMTGALAGKILGKK